MRKKLGHRGEDLSIQYLKKDGWAILKRNFTLGRYGEIDIIASKKDKATKQLVLFEARTRTISSFEQQRLKSMNERSVNIIKSRIATRDKHKILAYRVINEDIPNILFRYISIVWPKIKQLKCRLYLKFINQQLAMSQRNKASLDLIIILVAKKQNPLVIHIPNIFSLL